MDSRGLRQRTATGIAWKFCEIIGRRAVGVLVTLLLAHWLRPDDFGLIAAVSVFFALAATFSEAGFRQALIRKPQVSAADRDTMFYTNFALGLLAWGILILAAPAIAAFYRDERLIGLVRTLALIVPINSLSVVQAAELTRRLDFRSQFAVSLPGGLISGLVAVVLAWQGAGVRALVWQMILNSLITGLLYWRISDWRPGLSFCLASFRELFSFGSGMLIAGFIETLFQNVYVLVIGRFFIPALVGCYFFAQRILDISIEQLTASIHQVSFPALAAIQQEPERLRRACRQVLQGSAYLVFPAMTLLYVLAPSFFRLGLAPAWQTAAVYLQWLCLAGLVQPLHVVNVNILQVRGRSDLLLYLELIKKSMVAAALVISLPWGVEGLLIGRLVTVCLAYLPNSYYSGRLAGYPLPAQLADVLPVALASSGLALTLAGSEALLAARLPLVFLVPLQIAGGIAGYLFLAAALRLPAQTQIYSLLRDRFFRSTGETGELHGA